VQARAERQEGVRAVPVVRGADHRGLGARIARGVIVRAERVGRAERARERARPREVAAGDEQRDAEPPGRDGVTARDPTAAEEHEPSQPHEF